MVNATTMKKLFTLVNSTLLLTICGTVFSQPENSALAGINYQNEVNAGETKKISDPPGSKDAVLTTATVTFEPFKMIERTHSEKKVGPQGEDLIMKGHRFYYLNEKGKKVKVRKNEMKAMPKYR
jgi:hypothetical protein